MLPMKDKLGSVDANQMVALVRGFDGGKQIVELEAPKPEGPLITPGGEKPIVEKPTLGIPSNAIPRDLESSIAGAIGSLGMPTGYGPFFAASALLRGSKSTPPVAEPKISETEAMRVRAGATIFRQFCMVCHGPDGTGSLMRLTMPAIPNFTAEAFQKQRNDSELRVSILNGKGNLMPANSGRVTEGQARDLVAYVRSFGPASFGIKPEVSDVEFEKAVRSLEQQLEDLHKEMDKVKGKK
jgi:cytochrome c oxidase cbb3-type subunit 3